MKRVAFVFLLAASLAAAQAPATAISKVLTDSAAAWNRGDISAFMQSYWESPQTEFVGAGGVTRGWATVRDHYLKGYPNRAAMGTLTFTNIEVTDLCADAALATGEYHLARSNGEQHGYFTLVFRRIAGAGWRIVSDHTSAAAS